MTTYLSPGVYVEEVESGSRPIEGVGTAVAAFVGLTERGPLNEPTLVSNWRQFEASFGGFTGNSYLPLAVYGYFLNGGGNCYIVRIGDRVRAVPAVGELTAVSDGQPPLARYAIKAVETGAQANDISIEVTDAGSGGDGGGSAEDFKLTVSKGGKVAEVFDNLTTSKGKQNAVTIVNAQSKLIKLEETGAPPAVRPANAAVQLAGGSSTAPESLDSGDYIGDPAERTGFSALETIDEITMLCVPDLMAGYQQGWVDSAGVKVVQQAMIDHCELMGDRMAILDPPPELKPQKVLEWRVSDAGYDSKFAALYWPWVRVFDPASKANILVPPSGHIAGVWGRNDDTRGVHKAPANEVIRGVIDLACSTTPKEQELLNPQGVNCIRTFPSRGIRIWGARTLSSDPAWRYLNVRRLFNFLEESILNGTQWVVFEPNDDALWAKMRRTISAFLVTQWMSGALFGREPGEAFFVKCDRETNPAELIDLGQVVCEIGIAPVKPAEFVVFRLSQFSGGAAVAE